MCGCYTNTVVVRKMYDIVIIQKDDSECLAQTNSRWRCLQRSRTKFMLYLLLLNQQSDTFAKETRFTSRQQTYYERMSIFNWVSCHELLSINAQWMRNSFWQHKVILRLWYAWFRIVNCWKPESLIFFKQYLNLKLIWIT